MRVHIDCKHKSANVNRLLTKKYGSMLTAVETQCTNIVYRIVSLWICIFKVKLFLDFYYFLEMASLVDLTHWCETFSTQKRERETLGEITPSFDHYSKYEYLGGRKCLFSHAINHWLIWNGFHNNAPARGLWAFPLLHARLRCTILQQM